MTTLHYYSERAVKALIDSIDQHLDWYYEPTNRPPQPNDVQDPIRDSRIAHESLGRVLQRSKTGERDDRVNALIIYGALQLFPQQAADERLWAYLCHVEAADYTAARWLGARPQSNDAAVQKVRNHFFARGNRGLIRDNAISRLWWLGHIAHQVDPADPEAVLGMILRTQEVRSSLLERTGITRNIRVLTAVYHVLREYESLRSDLFVRDTFREFMKGLNRRGGVVLLDAVPDPDLKTLIRTEADQALNSAS